MKRKILISLALLVGLAVILIAVALNRANDIVAAFKPRIESELSRALDADVTLGALSVSVFPSTTLAISDLAIRSHGQKEEGIRLQNVSVAVSLLALLSKRLDVHDLRLNSPALIVVRDESGTYLQGLKPKKDRSTTAQTPPASAGKPSSPEAADEGIAIKLDRATVVDGSLVFDDKVAGRKVTLTDINVSTALDTGPSTGPDATANRVKVNPLTLSFSVDKLFPVSLHGTAIEVDRVSKLIKFGSADLALPGGTISASGELSPTGRVTFSTPSIDTPKLLKAIASIAPALKAYESVPAQVTKLSGSYAFEGALLTLDKGAAQLPGGAIDVSGKLAFASGLGGALAVKSTGLDLAQAYPTLVALVPAAKGYNPTGKALLDLDVKLGPPISLSGTTRLQDVAASLPTGITLAKATGAIDIKGTLPAISLELAALPMTLNDQAVTMTAGVQIEPSRMQLQRTVIAAAGGELRGPLTISFIGDKPLSVKPEVQGVVLQQLLMIVKPDFAPKFTGTISSLTSQLAFPLGGAGMKALEGAGNGLLVDGALKGFNIAAAVLTKLDFIGQAIIQEVPAEFKPVLQQPDTPIKKLTVLFSATKGVMTLSQADLESDIFTLRSRGTRASDGNLNLDATIFFTPEFSESLGKKIKEVRQILSAEGSLVIPLKLTGIPPQLVVTPNIRGLLETGAKKVLKEEASKALDKVFGGKGDPDVKKTLEGLLGL